jgi:hypothetical protein
LDAAKFTSAEKSDATDSQSDPHARFMRMGNELQKWMEGNTYVVAGAGDVVANQIQRVYVGFELVFSSDASTCFQFGRFPNSFGRVPSFY